MAILDIRSEVPKEIYVKGSSFDESHDKDHAHAAASTSNLIFLFFHYAHGIHVALAFFVVPPVFEPLRAFKLHL